MISFHTAGSRGGAPYASAKLALLCAILGSAWAARSIFNPLLDLAKADLAISDMHVGLVQGIALSLPAALLSIPVGRMIDTRNRVLLLVGLAAATMLGSVATALASSFTDLFVYRGLTGLGIMEEAVVLSLAADLFPPERRGRVTALIILAEYFGNALGFVFAGWLLPVASFMPLFTGASEWRMAPFLFGLAGLVEKAEDLAGRLFSQGVVSRRVPPRSPSSCRIGSEWSLGRRTWASIWGLRIRQ